MADYRVHVIDGKMAPGYDPPSMSLDPPPTDLAGLAAREDAARPAQRNEERPDDPHPTPHTPEGVQTPTDGPGWHREHIQTIADDMEAGGGVRNAAQIRALLADRDRLADEAATARRVADEWVTVATDYQEERDAARADIRLHRKTIDGHRERIDELEKARDLHADRAARLTDERDAARAEADQLRRELTDLRDGTAADTIIRALTDRRVHIDVDLRVRPEGT